MEGDIVAMSAREREWAAAIRRLVAPEIGRRWACELLDLKFRHAKELAWASLARGERGLVSDRRGTPSNNRLAASFGKPGRTGAQADDRSARTRRRTFSGRLRSSCKGCASREVGLRCARRGPDHRTSPLRYLSPRGLDRPEVAGCDTARARADTYLDGRTARGMRMTFARPQRSPPSMSLASIDSRS